jgi:hypothetical protein
MLTPTSPVTTPQRGLSSDQILALDTLRTLSAQVMSARDKLKIVKDLRDALVSELVNEGVSLRVIAASTDVSHVTIAGIAARRAGAQDE